MYVVAGVSGRTGSVAAAALLEAGQPVRVIVRDPAQGERAERWRARGAEVAVASLADDAALARALAGAKAAYLLSPQDLRDPDPIATGWRIADAVARAVERSALPHLVFLSAMGAQQADGTGIARTLHAAEERLGSAPASVTFLRAAMFLDTWALVLDAARAGKLPTFLRPERPVPLVATHDVGLVAARALLEGGGPGARQLIEVSGPREVSPRDLAAALSELLGRPVAADAAPLEAVVPTFTALGASPAFAEQLRQLYEGHAAGRLDPVGSAGGARTVRGTVEARAFFATALAGGRS
jgi:uncharacterized protein YbjT (DUF2867 family)